MIDPLDPTAFEAGIALGVLVLVALRLRADEAAFAPDARFWAPIRQYALTPLDHVLERIPGVFARSTVPPEEALAPLTIGLSALETDLAAAGYQRQPLASLATFTPTDDPERASFARYVGPKPFGIDALPEWLRREQIHARAFGPDGQLVPSAHRERNPWRPDQALRHLAGIGLEPARDALAADLDIDPVPYNGGRDT